jgi:hypothetical protein
MTDFIKISAQHVRHVSGYEVYSVDRFHIGFEDATGKYKIERELGWDPLKKKGHEYLYKNKMSKFDAEDFDIDGGDKDVMMNKVIEAIKFMDDFDVEVVL